MRHEVPQFIDIEDKIIGPLSFRQALYLIGGFFGAFSVYKIITYFLPKISFVIPLSLGAPILAFGVALAFLKVNDRPFIKFVEAWFYYTINPKRLSWQKKEVKAQKIEERHRFGGEIDTTGNPAYFANEEMNKVKNNRSKLKDLANQLDMSDEFQNESQYLGSDMRF